MAEKVIQVKNVSKSFPGMEDRTDNVKSFLVEICSGAFLSKKTKRFQALKDLNFDVYQGDTLGIMGRNGAGKSTLFRLLSGIYAPDSGEIIVKGKILPLVGLGAGFHSDLTGMENIFLNASVLGFGRNEIRPLVKDIVEFSELGDHIHVPVRKYSSGMLVRLGFSIASHIDAPILLLDEVLSVGDRGFQVKSLNKVLELIRSGRTVLLVSHDLEDIQKYCSRCIVVEGGKVCFDGDVSQGVKVYQELFPDTHSNEE